MRMRGRIAAGSSRGPVNPLVWAILVSGLKLVEVQQTSETTSLLYDYGWPRELHLKRALAVADGV